eukprot:m.82616 g.82616  ORF g.82616 m.82616 type:complete len:364 (+) comp12092_c1_seq4:931-2022(+)
MFKKSNIINMFGKKIKDEDCDFVKLWESKKKLVGGKFLCILERKQTIVFVDCDCELFQQSVIQCFVQNHDAPDLCWEILSVKQPFKQLPLKPYTKPKSPKPEGALRCVCISDTHSFDLSKLVLPEGDVLIHAGDFTNVGRVDEVKEFSAFLKSTDFKHKIVIAGNHDLSFDEKDYEHIYYQFHDKPIDCKEAKAALEGCTYLEDSSYEIEGVSFYGSPYQPRFYDWGFNQSRGEESLNKWMEIPDGVDVLVTHGPAIGHGDTCMGGNRAGCVDLLQQIQTRVRPQYHVFGHIHEGYGVSTDGQTTFVNASTCNYNYRPVQAPLVFDVFPHQNKEKSEEEGEVEEEDRDMKQDNTDEEKETVSS